ncbi:dUTPase [Psittacid alphaherpesvirus 1]|uniref:Deoxyuridine 5'-triphosphate nucleotidohydrolase n=1 Tax=Psittacid herpesvirus 1 (isolate Amazon parrot/-/97-0001/1997) TaxID=670426 RepID=DUT_PSHV1|nr:deoxyuridine triphosphatase [Psittacid alphaherpesvirus 1]Q6UDM0.1 RecName: Full=Deoxyuridine 5'-triphosphate nucleotidohydrolase; Short=dUTPase; AltName: Full=dUTP pyrophosphatase [Psittacid herpesvirus 1 Amazon parrot/1997]AAQ73690.1 dUTPase [Psittacid alphaherpesvirus 1]
MEATTKKMAMIEIGKGWAASCLEARTCVISNEEDIYAEPRADTPVLKLDSTVRTALPPGYGIVISGTARNHKTAWEIVPGLVDSGYTGLLGLLLVPTDETPATGSAGGGIVSFSRGGVHARLTVIKLVPDDIMGACGAGAQRLPLKTAITSFKGDEDLLGNGFDHCMESLASIYPDILHVQLDCPVYFGCTGCKAFYRRLGSCLETRPLNELGSDHIYLRRGSAYESVNRFAAPDDVMFVAMYGKWLLIGMAETPNEKLTVELRDDDSSPAALIPFHDTFGQKEAEDAGYDIRAPENCTLPPGGSVRVILRQKLHMGKGRAAFVMGRSSMNLKGVLVEPERVVDDEWVSFNITNIRDAAAFFRKNDRIAQLVALEDKLELMGGVDALPWRVVQSVQEEKKNSSRGDKGFGSSGV